MLNRIAVLREQRGMSQSELAAKAGVSRATIWHLETADEEINTTTKTLAKIASALCVKLDELLTHDGQN